MSVGRERRPPPDRVMRRVRGAGRVLDEDRLGGVRLVYPRHEVDGLVGHRGDEVPGSGWLAQERIDLCRVAEEVRLLLVGISADEAVEILKAHACRPLVERSDLAGCEGRRVVVLSDPSRTFAAGVYPLRSLVWNAATPGSRWCSCHSSEPCVCRRTC